MKRPDLSLNPHNIYPLWGFCEICTGPKVPLHPAPCGHYLCQNCWKIGEEQCPNCADEQEENERRESDAQ